MPRIAAIDFGLKRIGIALSDDRKQIAFPFATVEGGKKGALHVLDSLKGKEVERIIIGLPLLLSGAKGEMATLVEAFVSQLQALTPTPIELVDERFSSLEADRRLKESEMNRKERTQKLDSATAAILLQSYLDKNNSTQL
jgi:putative Holliday junction resolvase